MRRWSAWALAALGVALLGGCGATSRNPHDDAASSGSGSGNPNVAGTGGGSAGNPGAGGSTAGSAGSGGRPAAPMIDGVPIGDCRVPTEPRAGCPEKPPEFLSPCEAPSGLKQCTYAISTNHGRATQLIFTCHPDQLMWGSFEAPCGMTCPAPQANVLELSAKDCDARPLTTCKDAGSVVAFETAQQWLDNAFVGVLSQCLGEMRYSKQLQLELDGGCPTRFSSDHELTPAQTSCLSTQLNQLRWECALDLSCTTFSAYPTAL